MKTMPDDTIESIEAEFYPPDDETELRSKGPEPINIPFRPNELPVILDAFAAYQRELERNGEPEPPELEWVATRVHQARVSHVEHQRRSGR
jgi:hypothetical protein